MKTNKKTNQKIATQKKQVMISPKNASGSINEVSEAEKNKEIDKKKASLNNSIALPIPHSNEGKTAQIKVIARFRPPNTFEEELTKKDSGNICVNFNSTDTVTLTSSLYPKATFTFDKVFGCETTQSFFFNDVIKEIIFEVLDGYNGTIFTYGQSGSGKTHTMFGKDLYSEDLKGIIPRSIELIFDHITNAKDQTQYQIHFSILEIYRENIYDLLNPDTKTSDLKIKEDPKKGTYVDQLTTISVEEKEEFFAIIEAAEENRSIAETRLNKVSSRSHVVFVLQIKQKLADDTEKVGILNLVDLAGSEKISKTGAVGETLEEAKKINQSLSCLGNVINCLTGSNKDFVPYRESKLTRLLKDSLGGNYKTTLIVACSPHSYNAEDTMSTLNFAKRAKKVKNKVKLNIKRSPEELEKIIASLEEKLKISNLEVVRLKNGKENLDEYSTLATNDQLSQRNVQNNQALIQEKDNIIFEKDNEIFRLKEEIESIKGDNNNLTKELEKSQRLININQTLTQIEKSIKLNLNEIENLFTRYKFNIEELYYDENMKLKESLAIKDMQNYENLIGILKKDLEFDFSRSQKKINSEIKDFIDSMSKYEVTDYIHKSYESIFKNAKYLISDSISSLLSNVNLTNQTQFSKLENNNEFVDNFMKISGLAIFYEKIIHDLLGKVSIDIRHFDLNQSYNKDNTDRLFDLNKNFSQFIEMVEELKKIQNKNLIAPAANTKKSFLDLYKESKKSAYNVIGDGRQSKFIRTVTKKQSNFINGLNFLGKYDMDVILEDQDLNSNNENKENTKQDEGNSLEKNDAVAVGSFEDSVKVQDDQINSNFRKKTKVSFNVNDKEKEISLQQELRLLRREKQFDKDFIQRLTKESSELHSKIFKYDKSILEYQNYLKSTLSKDFDNMKLFIQFVKEAFRSKLYKSESKICELSCLIDDIILNNKGFKLNDNFKIFYEQKKKLLLSENENEYENYSHLMMNDSGTASRKLDYILYDFSGKGSSKYNIVLGSGLSKMIPSKCPLNKYPNDLISGDQNSELWEPDT